MGFPETLLWRFFQRFGAVLSVQLHMLSSGKYTGVRTNIRTSEGSYTEDDKEISEILKKQFRYFFPAFIVSSAFSFYVRLEY